MIILVHNFEIISSEGQGKKSDKGYEDLCQNLKFIKIVTIWINPGFLFRFCSVFVQIVKIDYSNSQKA
jgi:hypothetical protein